MHRLMCRLIWNLSSNKIIHSRCEWWRSNLCQEGSHYHYHLQWQSIQLILSAYWILFFSFSCQKRCLCAPLFSIVNMLLCLCAFFHCFSSPPQSHESRARPTERRFFDATVLNSNISKCIRIYYYYSHCYWWRINGCLLLNDPMNTGWALWIWFWLDLGRTIVCGIKSKKKGKASAQKKRERKKENIHRGLIWETECKCDYLKFLLRMPF